MFVNLKSIATIALLGSIPAASYAQSSASVSTTGTARIVQPISIAKTSDLAFGTIVKPSVAGTNTVTVDASTGNRSLSGSGDAVAAGGTTSRAAYTVSGEGGQTFSISVPASFSMTGTPGGTITVTLTPSAATGTLSSSIGTAGTATFGVGGSFSLPNTQASGNYSGTFTATVAYN
ncbi:MULTISPECIES: DUF4402 domain-containing protein [unclassified Sphingobium]|uniref:DUF4402 domain-containing protein n=1 Tax=unclassified Sphingobium TaxID=2611147 RepID=UPI0022243CC7|nr:MULTISPECIES: DUF4402 domain-containing protein [unclassified Sphingobium]